MSVAVRRALYGKLAGDTTLTAMLHAPPPGRSKSIFYQVAPAGALFPYVIFQEQSGTPRYAMKGVAFDNEVWTVKGVDNTGTSSDPGSSDTVDGIASRLDALLTDATLSISGKTHLYLRREGDVVYVDPQDGVVYQHAGAEFRLIYT